VSKPQFIELPTGEQITILYEDRSVIAIDKPRGWMLVPMSWQNTGRNLQAALTSSIAAKDFWARSRGLKTLRHIHRLDADTSGILLLGKSPGAINAYSALFESRSMDKRYLAIVQGAPREVRWTCAEKIGPDPRRHGRMKVDPRSGKDAETYFNVLQTADNRALIEVKPLTGRTHQIRIHLAHAGFPVIGDELYGRREASRTNLGLRAVALSYRDPFTSRHVQIEAPVEDFLREYGFKNPKGEGARA
jgi:23S rRNA pseudouridine1911/1915/1917 synthase